MYKSKIVLFIFLLLGQTMVYSQKDTNIIHLKGKHAISLSMGMKTNSGTYIFGSSYNGRDNADYYNGNIVDAKTGFIGSLSYMYWFDNQWAINFQIGVINAEASVNIGDVSTNSIAPILFGFKFYPEFLSLGSVGRVYAGLNMGAYIGASTRSSLWIFHQTSVETVFGFEPNIGVDLFVADWLRIGPSLSWDIHEDFHDVSVRNDNSIGFTVNFGIVF
jgi:hypothetical protein